MESAKTNKEEIVVKVKPDQNNEYNAIDNSEMDPSQLPLDVWEKIFEYISVIDTLKLSLICKQFQWIVQQIKSSVDLTLNYYFNNDSGLNNVLSNICTEINLNHCYWLEPNSILQIISGSHLRHLHVIGCKVNEHVMRGIINLHLISFSFTYSKEWRGYFLEHSAESSYFLRRLNKLNIHVKQRNWLDKNPPTILFDIYVVVLKHCKELQHLKMFDHSSGYHSFFKAPPSGFPSQPTFLPKLKSLVIDIDYNYFSQNAQDFLEAILRDKIIPLEHLDFGLFNCYLLQEGIRHQPLILPEKEKLLLKNFYDNYKYNFESCIDDETLMSPTAHYKKICLQHLKIQNFSQFATKVCLNSGKSIVKLSLVNCKVKENIVSGIEVFALNCPQITVLELTISNWLEYDHAVHPEDYSDDEDDDDYNTNEIFNELDNNSVFNTAEIEKNETLLEVLAKFKNLKKLSISPLMLQCVYYTPRDKKRTIHEMPFWKVTIECPQLRELRISKSNSNELDALVHLNTLYDIAHCKNLKSLNLVNFSIRGNAKFFLSKITKSCLQLEDFGIQLNRTFINNHAHPFDQSFTLEDSFNFASNLKKLKIDNFLPYSADVIDSLSRCEHLEKLDLCIKGKECIQYLMDSLSKFENLFVFTVRPHVKNNKEFFQPLCSEFQKIKDKKPAFFGTVHCLRHFRSFSTLNNLSLDSWGYFNMN